MSEIDWDEQVEVVYGAGTGNEVRCRVPRYMVFDAPVLSAFVDFEDECERSKKSGNVA